MSIIKNKKRIDVRFKKNNKRIAEEVVGRFLAELKSLLTLTLIAVIEALRINLDRHALFTMNG
jgi:hypothetical protein